MPNNKSFGLVLILIIGLFSFLLSFQRVSTSYSFEWDQADDAAKVVSMIDRHKPLLIGPQVSNQNSFFVGPYHYYYLLPFYIFTKGDPVAGQYALILINVITSVTAFILISKIFNPLTGFLASLFLTIILGKTCWSVMYAPLISIISFYICYQAINHKFSFIWAMFFAGLISNIHLVPISLVPIIIFSFVIGRQKISLKEILLGIVAFIIPFLPLVVFDLRHNFLNTQKILELISGTNSSGQIYSPFLWLRSFWRSLSLLNIMPALIERSLFLLILLVSPFLMSSKLNRWLSFVWVLLPLIILSFYHGAISEYYYALVTSLIPVYLALILVKFLKNPILIIIVSIFLTAFVLFKQYSSSSGQVTLNDKKTVIRYLITQTQDQPFYLSYETGLGMDFGFDYLLSFYRRPSKIFTNGHLYTLYTNDTLPKDSQVVFHHRIYSLVRR